MSRFALDERQQLANTLRTVGPGAPTLCTPWTSTELVAHLIQRERSGTEVAGRLPVAALRRLAEQRLRRYASSRHYSQLVAEFEAGPPIWSPFRLPPVREAIDLLEYVVHHEDVRRAPGSSLDARTLSVRQSQAVWRLLRPAARLLLRTAPVAVRLCWEAAPGGPSMSEPRSGPDPVSVSGDPVELALVVFGRQQVARVEWKGSADRVNQLQAARLSV